MSSSFASGNPDRPPAHLQQYHHRISGQTTASSKPTSTKSEDSFADDLSSSSHYRPTRSSTSTQSNTYDESFTSESSGWTSGTATPKATTTAATSPSLSSYSDMLPPSRQGHAQMGPRRKSPTRLALQTIHPQDRMFYDSSSAASSPRLRTHSPLAPSSPMTLQHRNMISPSPLSTTAPIVRGPGIPNEHIQIDSATNDNHDLIFNAAPWNSTRGSTASAASAPVLPYSQSHQGRIEPIQRSFTPLASSHGTDRAYPAQQRHAEDSGFREPHLPWVAESGSRGSVRSERSAYTNVSVMTYESSAFTDYVEIGEGLEKSDKRRSHGRVEGGIEVVPAMLQKTFGPDTQSQQAHDGNERRHQPPQEGSHDPSRQKPSQDRANQTPVNEGSRRLSGQDENQDERQGSDDDNEDEDDYDDDDFDDDEDYSDEESITEEDFYAIYGEFATDAELQYEYEQMLLRKSRRGSRASRMSKASRASRVSKSSRKSKAGHSRNKSSKASVKNQFEPNEMMGIPELPQLPPLETLGLLPELSMSDSLMLDTSVKSLGFSSGATTPATPYVPTPTSALSSRAGSLRSKTRRKQSISKGMPIEEQSATGKQTRVPARINIAATQQLLPLVEEKPIRSPLFPNMPVQGTGYSLETAKIELRNTRPAQRAEALERLVLAQIQEETAKLMKRDTLRQTEELKWKRVIQESKATLAALDEEQEDEDGESRLRKIVEKQRPAKKVERLARAATEPSEEVAAGHDPNRYLTRAATEPPDSTTDGAGQSTTLSNSSSMRSQTGRTTMRSLNSKLDDALAKLANDSARNQNDRSSKASNASASKKKVASSAVDATSRISNVSDQSLMSRQKSDVSLVSVAAKPVKSTQAIIKQRARTLGRLTAGDAEEAEASDPKPSHEQQNQSTPKTLKTIRQESPQTPSTVQKPIKKAEASKGPTVGLGALDFRPSSSSPGEKSISEDTGKKDGPTTDFLSGHLFGDSGDFLGGGSLFSGFGESLDLNIGGFMQPAPFKALGVLEEDEDEAHRVPTHVVHAKMERANPVREIDSALSSQESDLAWKAQSPPKMAAKETPESFPISRRGLERGSSNHYELGHPTESKHVGQPIDQIQVEEYSASIYEAEKAPEQQPNVERNSSYVTEQFPEYEEDPIRASQYQAERDRESQYLLGQDRTSQEKLNALRESGYKLEDLRESPWESEQEEPAQEEPRTITHYLPLPERLERPVSQFTMATALDSPRHGPPPTIRTSYNSDRLPFEEPFMELDGYDPYRQATPQPWGTRGMEPPMPPMPQQLPEMSNAWQPRGREGPAIKQTVIQKANMDYNKDLPITPKSPAELVRYFRDDSPVPMPRTGTNGENSARPASPRSPQSPPVERTAGPAAASAEVDTSPITLALAQASNTSPAKKPAPAFPVPRNNLGDKMTTPMMSPRQNVPPPIKVIPIREKKDGPHSNISSPPVLNTGDLDSPRTLGSVESPHTVGSFPKSPRSLPPRTPLGDRPPPHSPASLNLKRNESPAPQQGQSPFSGRKEPRVDVARSDVANARPAVHPLAASEGPYPQRNRPQSPMVQNGRPQSPFDAKSRPQAPAQNRPQSPAVQNNRPQSPAVKEDPPKLVSPKKQSGKQKARDTTASTASAEGPSARDRYGFTKASRDISLEEYNAWNYTYAPYLARRRKKWEALMKAHNCMPPSGAKDQIPKQFPPRSEKVKRYIRKGIPPEWRGNAWFWYAGGQTMLAREPSLYKHLCAKAEMGHRYLGDADREGIERDLHRTFPDNILFKPDGPEQLGFDGKERPETPMVSALRRVLQAFAIHNPNIGYCQSLNFIAGLLLLFLDGSEEKAFTLLNVITNTHLPGVHAKVLEADVDIGVLLMCVQESLPAVWAKISDADVNADTPGEGEEGGPESRPASSSGKKRARRNVLGARLPTVSVVLTSWFMCLFVSSLPMEAVVRVWDTLFYEGSKALFRIALAVLKTGETEIKGIKEQLEMFQVVQSVPRKLLDVNALVEICYKRRGGFGGLSQNTIEQRRRERREVFRREKDKKDGGRRRGRTMASQHAPSDGTPPVPRDGSVPAMPTDRSRQVAGDIPDVPALPPMNFDHSRHPQSEDGHNGQHYYLQQPNTAPGTPASMRMPFGGGRDSEASGDPMAYFMSDNEDWDSEAQPPTPTSPLTSMTPKMGEADPSPVVRSTGWGRY